LLAGVGDWASVCGRGKKNRGSLVIPVVVPSARLEAGKQGGYASCFPSVGCCFNTFQQEF
jgi:hypothetical protein